jgi:ectoine hydroxylase-related dioxygenase (phytanoyl-CoA dioxygenase family)
MDRKERYFWDLTGYLVVRSVLTEAEIDEVNGALDHVIDSGGVNTDPENRGARDSESLKGKGPRWAFNTNMLDLPKPHCDSIRRLLVHPQVVVRLNEMCGKGWRLDHGPQFNNAVKGTVGLTLHGKGDPHGEAVGYKNQGDLLYCGGLTVSWNLTDCPAGGGGFVCAPGSHKSKYPLPDGVVTCDDDGGAVVQPELRAGDVLFFMDGAQTHGTHPWRNDHDRRSLLFKYASRTSTRSGPSREVYLPETYWDASTCVEMSPEEQAVMHGPGSGMGNRNMWLTVATDGTVKLDTPDGKPVEAPTYPPEEGRALVLGRQAVLGGVS